MNFPTVKFTSPPKMASLLTTSTTFPQQKHPKRSNFIAAKEKKREVWNPPPVPRLDTPEDISAWIQERKRRHPCTAKVQEGTEEKKKSKLEHGSDNEQRLKENRIILRCLRLLLQ